MYWKISKISDSYSIKLRGNSITEILFKITVEINLLEIPI